MKLMTITYLQSVVCLHLWMDRQVIGLRKYLKIVSEDLGQTVFEDPV